MNKPKILCVAGYSGCGKTTLAEYYRNLFGISMIESYTDRPKREENEVGHTFISPEEYDKLKLEDMIAYTKFGDYRYCCLKQDIKPNNTYVIDEAGIRYLKSNFGKDYDITTLWIKSSNYNIFRRLEKEYGLFEATKRADRDRTRELIPLEEYDYIIDNNSDLGSFLRQGKSVLNDWLNNELDKLIESWR